MLTVLISCADKRRDSKRNIADAGTTLDKDEDSARYLADDYAVFNHVLPHLGVFKFCLDCSIEIYSKKYDYDNIEKKI